MFSMVMIAFLCGFIGSAAILAENLLLSIAASVVFGILITVALLKEIDE